jgi:hypothetical protein
MRGKPHSVQLLCTEQVQEQKRYELRPDRIERAATSVAQVPFQDAADDFDKGGWGIVCA